MLFFKSLFDSSGMPPGHTQVLSVQDFMIGVQSSDAQLIDVRTQKEYDDEHIRDAININIQQPMSFKKLARRLDKNSSIYVYSPSGNRSEKAARLFIELGFTKIYDLKGGILSLK